MTKFDNVIPGMTGTQYLASREAIQETLCDCSRDSGSRISTGMCTLMETIDDIMSDMAVAATKKDDRGFHHSTETSISVLHQRYLKDLSKKVGWFEIRPTAGPTKKSDLCSVALWLNGDLGNTANAWRLLKHDFLHIVEFPGDFGRKYERRYAKFKLLVEKIKPTTHDAQDYSVLSHLADSCELGKLDNKYDSISVPFLVHDALGFDEPVILHENYHIANMYSKDGEVFFRLYKKPGRSMIMGPDNIFFKNPTSETPKTVTVPVDAIVHHFSGKWNGYYHSELK